MNQLERGTCRFCGQPLSQLFADLGTSPVANSYVRHDNFQGEQFFPLRVHVCSECKLVQAEPYETPEHIFSEYAYFSSTSKAWLQHCKEYCQKMEQRLHLNQDSFVVEVASNDGYLLTNFVQSGIPVLGVEPAENIAEEARQKGVPTRCEFFGEQAARRIVEEYGHANLVIGNNVLAHVPDLHDFIRGLRILLSKQGVLTMEFPHLLKLIEECQFDTIYHEHFYYYSLLTAQRMFAHFGLTISDVEELPTHGGSLRIYARPSDAEEIAVSASVERLLEKEREAQLHELPVYQAFNQKIQQVKRDALSYLIAEKNAGKRIAAFGAPAKGNTFLNYCGIGRDFIEFTVDDTPYKQGLFLPGSRIPIYAREKLVEERPDIVLILPWNWAGDIVPQLDFVKEYGGEIITLIPTLKKH